MEKTTKKITKVAFFGDSDAKKSDQHYRLAFETAKLLAENGYEIVDGGGPGIMAAATLGAKKAGGRVEVVVIKKEDEPDNYEGTDKKNLGLADIKHTTNNIDSRTDELMEIADAFVIFKGGTGTLWEVGTVWGTAKFEYGHHKPLIFVGREWREVVEDIVKKMELENKEKRVVATVEKPEEVLKALKQVESQI
jgi:uncharacterized protein (TIGR00725 family)